MKNKTDSRTRRATPTRMKIRELGATRLCVHRSGKHMYAQVTTPDGAKTIVAASTLEEQFKSKSAVTSNVEAAKEVGKLIAERALQAGIKVVAFDRSGFRYHGRVKAVADAAREVGLEF